jgi:CubicO group peptidase (beta-lactamase class C family)
MLLTTPRKVARLHAAVDPMRRVRVPRDLGPLVSVSPGEQDPAAVGMSRERVEGIWRGALALYRSGMYPALGLCVRRHGEVVLDRSVGWARGGGPGEHGTRVAATPETPYCVYSASKAVTATVIHLLHERGLLDVNARVAEYVAEFDRPHFDEITVDHVLSHRAGFPFIPRSVMDLDRFGDPEFLRSSITAVRIRNRPGAAQSYHAVSGGFVLGEIVREVAGADIATVLRREILDPLGFRWTAYGAAPADQDLLAHDYATGPRLLPPASRMLTRVLGASVEELVMIARDPRFLSGVVPAGNVVTTANELSRFMDLLRQGGSLDGTRIMNAKTIRRATVERSYHEIDRSLGLPIRFSSGYMLGAKAMSLYGPDTDEAFGHLGFTNVMGWTDPRRELSVALMTNGNPVVGPHLPGLWNLTRLIGAAAPKVADPVLYG